MITAAIQAAIDRLAAYNTGEYDPVSNPYGLSGEGGTDANFDALWRDVTTVSAYLGGLVNDINFMAERATITTILQQAQSLVAQITTPSVSSLSFPALDKALVTASDVADVCIYDTRLDAPMADGSRWAEPGRCAHTSWYQESPSTVRGPKRDLPLRALLYGRANTLMVHDDLDLDPATGAPRAWKQWPVFGLTCIHAAQGRILYGAAGGLYIIDLPADRVWRYSTGGLSLANQSVADYNQSTATWTVVAPASAIVSDAVTMVHARVLPGAPLNAATIPLPWIMVLTAGGRSVVDPTGRVVHLTSAGDSSGCYLSDNRIAAAVSAGGVDVGWLPYATAASSSWRQASYTSTTAPALLGAAVGVVAIPGGFAARSASGLSLVREDVANPANGMVATVTVTSNTGWQPGDIRLAALCDNTVGAVTEAELIVNGGFDVNAAGWNVVTNGGTATQTTPAAEGIVSPAADGLPAPKGSGILKVVFGTTNAGAYQAVPTVPGETYVVTGYVYSVGNNGPRIYVGTTSISNNLAWGSTSSFARSPQDHWTPFAVTFTATTAISYLQLWASVVTGRVAYYDEVSVRRAVPSRDYRGRGGIIAGTWLRSLLTSTSSIAAWTPQNGAYIEWPYLPDQDAGFGGWEDTVIGCAGGGATVETWLSRDSVTSGARRQMTVTAAGVVQYTVSDGVNVVTVTSVTNVRDGVPRRISGKVRRATGQLELWVAGVREATASLGSLGSLSNTSATLRVGLDQQGANAAVTSRIAMLRSGAYSCVPAQETWAASAEQALLSGPSTLGGTSNVVQDLDYDPLTGRLLVCTPAGSSVLRGLLRASYHTAATIPSAANPNHKAGALRGSTLLLGTAGQAAVYQEALGGKEAMQAGNMSHYADPLIAKGVTTDTTSTDLSPRRLVGEREVLLVRSVTLVRSAGRAAVERGRFVRESVVYCDAGGVVTLQGAVQTIGTDIGVLAGATVTHAIDTAARTVAVRVSAGSFTLGTIPIATASGSTTLTITHAGHGMATGDTVTIGGVASSIGGVTAANINGLRSITVVDANTYTVTAGAAATSAAAGGTAATVTPRLRWESTITTTLISEEASYAA